MPITQPERVWWKRLSGHERIWLWTSIAFCVALFASLPAWEMAADQRMPDEYYRVDAARYRPMVDAFIEEHQVGSEGRVPVVRPPEGDIYLLAFRFGWTPILELESGKTYRMFVSSVDVQHGLSVVLPPAMNVQVVPGYVTALTITPQEPGEYPIVCNQFCGVGHETMSGRIIVRE